MKRIIFLNRFFHPDHSATSQILSDLAFHLAGCGHDVCVVTSRQRYDDARAERPDAETIRGVEVHRLATTGFGRSALLGRAHCPAAIRPERMAPAADMVRRCAGNTTAAEMPASLTVRACWKLNPCMGPV